MSRPPVSPAIANPSAPTASESDCAAQAHTPAASAETEFAKVMSGVTASNKLAQQSDSEVSAQPEIPSRLRRIACLFYEGVLLFGVVFIAGYLFDTLTQSRHALTLRHARQAWLFLVLGLYFVWFWTHGGQTLAQKTWRIRVVDQHGQPIGWWRAIARYVLCWPLVFSGLGLLWSLFDRDRQFLQDRIAGTRLITHVATHRSLV